MRTQSFLAACLACLPLVAPARTPAPVMPPLRASQPPAAENPHPMAAPSPWAELADYTLTVKVPPRGDTGTWKFRTFADPADAVVDLDTPGPRGRTRGSIMLVGGQAIAARGFTPEPGFEIDPLDTATLNLKILARLLDAAVPGGPSALKGRQAVQVHEAKLPLIASTPSANARFNAPWSLKGTVERVDSDTIAFQLELDVPGGDKSADRARWNFAGTAGGTTRGRVLQDSTSLAGWTAYVFGPARNARQSHTTLKFGATRLPGPFATLKDLRAFLAKPAQSGKP